MASQPSDQFLKQNFKYFQGWHHWHDKAASLRKQANALYSASLPELRLFEKATRRGGKALKKKSVVAIEHPHPGLLPTFSLNGSALENLFKGAMVTKTRPLSASISSRIS